MSLKRDELYKQYNGERVINNIGLYVTSKLKCKVFQERKLGEKTKLMGVEIIEIVISECLI